MRATEGNPKSDDNGTTLEQLRFDRLSREVRGELRRLCTLDNYHGPLAILFELALIALSIAACVGISYWFYPVALLLIGSTQRFLAHFLHESAHKSFMKNKALNFIGGTVFSGYLVLYLHGPYRSSHVGNHHRNLGDAETDPDYGFHIECGLYDTQRSNRRFFVKEVLFSVLGLRTVDYLRYITRDRILCDSSKLSVSVVLPVYVERVLLLTQWTLIIGACAWFHVLPELLLFWFVPLCTTNVSIGWLAELAEHYPLPEGENQRLLLTRNRHGRLVERFLLSRHNDRFHLIHHLNAGIPFWSLARAHRVLLKDPAYVRWDGLWAGILTRPRSRQGKETVISYAAKYRDWRQAGGDPATSDSTFAELMMLARESGEPELFLAGGPK
ncbi:fatty acid desaturase family protein [Streptomyces sp. NPDC048506]|uniref:fatty acid desaturase family protein n=1 Tax=Streptomyces sp. NPDC048506 TaxID=3155028 RepID=UPI0034250A4A